MIVVNEDKSINVTRGDVANFMVCANVDEERITFKPGQVLRIKVFEKKNAENVVLQKDFTIAEECEEAAIQLTGADTKIGEVISKPVDYWYEIVLNPFTNPQTIVGYDDDGAKIFKLFPEGGEVDDSETNPEEVVEGGVAAILSMVYPIGAVYISGNDTNPGDLFGGTWERMEGALDEVFMWKRTA